MKMILHPTVSDDVAVKYDRLWSAKPNFTRWEISGGVVITTVLAVGGYSVMAVDGVFIGVLLGLMVSSLAAVAGWIKKTVQWWAERRLAKFLRKHGQGAMLPNRGGDFGRLRALLSELPASARSEVLPLWDEATRLTNNVYLNYALTFEERDKVRPLISERYELMYAYVSEYHNRQGALSKVGDVSEYTPIVRDTLLSLNTDNTARLRDEIEAMRAVTKELESGSL